MKALIKKDIMVLMKQIKYVLIFFLLFTVISAYSTERTLFVSGVLIAFALFPITALSYDEQSHWDSLALTMPYSSAQIVLSKFILGYIGSLIAVLFSTVINIIIPLIAHKSVYTDNLMITVLGQFITLIFTAIMLAFGYRFGVQKGKILFIVIVIVCAVIMPLVVMGISSLILTNSIIFDFSILLLLVVFSVSATVNIICILVSIHNYKNRKFIVK